MHGVGLDDAVDDLVTKVGETRPVVPYGKQLLAISEGMHRLDNNKVVYYMSQLVEADFQPVPLGSDQEEVVNLPVLIAFGIYL